MVGTLRAASESNNKADAARSVPTTPSASKVKTAKRD